MASERSKRRDLLACIFITKSISMKLLILLILMRNKGPEKIDHIIKKSG